MSWVTILKVEIKVWNSKEKFLLHFKNEKGEPRYVEFNSKVRQYWSKYLKDDLFQFQKGMKINVFRVPNQKYYTIRGVQV